MKKFIVLFCLLTFPGFIMELHSQGKNLPFNLSVIYPVSINTSKSDNVNFNIGIIGSSINSLNGFGINGVYSVLENDINGVQINGIYSETRNKLKGIQIAGAVNALTEGGSGIMAGGIGNLSFNEFKGLQIAGISNLSFEDVKGMQIGGIFNMAGKNVSIMQFALAGNVAGENTKGIQLSGLFNLSGTSNRGLQLSSINLTKEQRGLQFGFINACDDNNGLQLGIVNITGKKQNGAVIGLMNAFGDTRIQLLLTGGSIAYGMFGIRFKTNSIYTAMQLGMPVVHSNTTKSIMFNYHAGYSFDLNYLNLNADAGFNHFSNESNQTEGKSSKNQFGISLRAGLEKQIIDKLGIFLNAGILFLADSYVSPNFSNKFILEGGFTIL